MSYQVDLLDRNIAIAEGKSTEALRILWDYANKNGRPAEAQFTIEGMNELLADDGLECAQGTQWDARIELEAYEGYWTHFPDTLFEALAPVMEHGSIAVFIDEEHNVWRYLYRDGEVETQYIDLLGAEGWR